MVRGPLSLIRFRRQRWNWRNSLQPHYGNEDGNAVENALRSACSRPNINLMQICYVNHTVDQTPPHIHLQCLFSDHTRTPWLTCTTDNIDDLTAAVARMPVPASIHLHEHQPEDDVNYEPPNGGPLSESVEAALPRLVLTELAAERLIDDGFDGCPICLDDMCVGQEIVFIGCNGAHVAHSRCIGRWFVVASTCPNCRFMLPKEEDDLGVYLKPALAQRERVATGAAPPCPPCEDDDEGPEPKQTDGAVAPRPNLRPDTAMDPASRRRSDGRMVRSGSRASFFDTLVRCFSSSLAPRERQHL